MILTSQPGKTSITLMTFFFFCRSPPTNPEQTHNSHPDAAVKPPTVFCWGSTAAAERRARCSTTPKVVFTERETQFYSFWAYFTLQRLELSSQTQVTSGQQHRPESRHHVSLQQQQLSLYLRLVFSLTATLYHRAEKNFFLVVKYDCFYFSPPRRQNVFFCLLSAAEMWP